MIYHSFKDIQLPALGFGTMRMPSLPDGEPDQDKINELVDYALANGINYFDTALPYQDQKGETAVGKALARHPRDSWYLADKFPGHQVVGSLDMPLEETFQEQLAKCGVDYFDFYLLHNVNEHSLEYYMDRKRGCIDYFLKQKELGRIKYFGFSCHAAPESLRRFLEEFGDAMDFCQIQLNYLDWELQDAKQKVEILREFHIPVWVMEPVRGGKLAKLDAETEAKMRVLRPEESTPAWAFRWLQTVPQPTVVLSGMSNLAQIKDNVKTFSEEKPLNGEEIELLYSAAAKLHSFIPCTGCRYCVAGCPQKLNIPLLISFCNDQRVHDSINTVIRYASLGDRTAEACIGCGKCARACPQKIDVPGAMKELASIMEKKQTWEQICIQRETARKALEQG